jgi:hypothetical protein
MTKLAKIRLLDKIDKETAQFNALKHIVFLCNNCGFKVAVTDRSDPYIECQVGNYHEYDVDPKQYGKYIKKNEKNINGTFWSKPASHICLNCGNSIFYENDNIEKCCEKCNSKNIIFWKDLPRNKCPCCDGIFNEGIMFNSYDEYSEYNFKESINGLSKAKEKYGINEDKIIIKEYTEDEKKTIEEENKLLKYYMDLRYVINQTKNVIRYECHRSFHGPFYIIAKWDNDNQDGELIFCMYFPDKNEESFKKIILENNKIKILLSILDKYKYFTKPNEIKRMGLDGSTWTLEVQHGKLYKEIHVWSPVKGVIYDLGNLLIEYSGVKINEMY